MKRVISLVLALALVCGLAVTALAAGFDMSVDTDVVQAGETVTATITLDEAVVGAAQVQIELYYDPEVLTCSSKTLASGFEFLSIVDYDNFIGFNWLDMTFKGQDLAAGTVATVTFTANDIVSAADLELSIAATYGDITGAMNILDPVSVDMTVCPGHEYYSYTTEGTCKDPVTVIYECIYCGHSYPGESEGVYGEHECVWVPGTVTCTEDGYLEYMECSVCGACFDVMDYDYENPLTKEDFYTEAGHQEASWPNTTYNDDGSITNQYYCYLCNEVLREEILMPGDNGNPIYVNVMDCPTTINVSAGDSDYYYLTGFSGYYVTISGGDLTVEVIEADWYGNVTGSTVYEDVDGVVTYKDNSTRFSAPTVKITNNSSSDAVYTINYSIPVGNEGNPATLYDGTNSVDVPEGTEYGYYTTYTPNCDGELTITVSGDNWVFTVNSFGDPDDYSDDHYGDEHFHGDEEPVNTETISVKAGYPVEVVLCSYWVEEGEYWWDSTYHYPASTLTVDVEFVPAHNVVHVDAKAPSCFEEGNVEYWYCDVCGAAWLDADCTKVTNLLSVILPASCPEVKHVEAKAPSCFEEGNIEYWYCTNEEHGTVWIDENLMQISNHMSVKLAPWCQDVVHMEAVEPGCHYTGNVEHWYCTNPEHGTVWTDEARTEISNHMSVILPALGGEVTHVEAAEADCRNPGHIEYWYCEECEQFWQDEALTQLTNSKNVITEAALGFVDEDEDGVCDICNGNNPHTGDFTIVAAAAAAVISLTGVVALPVAKKKFF